jgi:hypothetical protein
MARFVLESVADAEYGSAAVRMRLAFTQRYDRACVAQQAMKRLT